MPEPDQTWDAGEIGCAHLIMRLRAMIEALPPGGTIEVIARSRGASEDLASWCRLTGHQMLSAKPPSYLIRRGPEHT
jgi:tRNA 2-thiouridine synthesizing protein A